MSKASITFATSATRCPKCGFPLPITARLSSLTSDIWSASAHCHHCHSNFSSSFTLPPPLSETTYDLFLTQLALSFIKHHRDLSPHILAPPLTQ